MRIQHLTGFIIQKQISMMLPFFSSIHFTIWAVTMTTKLSTVWTHIRSVSKLFDWRFSWKTFLNTLIWRKKDTDNKRLEYIIENFLSILNEHTNHILNLMDKKESQFYVKNIYHMTSRLGVQKFVWFDSLRPINNLSVKQGQVFLGWTSTKLR